MQNSLFFGHKIFWKHWSTDYTFTKASERSNKMQFIPTNFSVKRGLKIFAKLLAIRLESPLVNIISVN